MEIERTNGCCAVSEICHLQDDGTPEAAMKEFLCYYEDEGEFDYNTYQYKYSGKIDWDNIDAFILFTGVERTYYNNPHQNNSIRKGYTNKFASYIKRHKLGSVSASVIRRNRVNHPEHGIRVYTWAPSIAGLKKWAKKHVPEIC